jgi:hypothetical protein
MGAPPAMDDVSPATLADTFEPLFRPACGAHLRASARGEVLVMAALAVMAGADAWDETGEWAEARQKWLRPFRCRVAYRAQTRGGAQLRAIDSKKFAACSERAIAQLSGSQLPSLRHEVLRSPLSGPEQARGEACSSTFRRRISRSPRACEWAAGVRG